MPSTAGRLSALGSARWKCERATEKRWAAMRPGKTRVRAMSAMMVQAGHNMPRLTSDGWCASCLRGVPRKMTPKVFVKANMDMPPMMASEHPAKAMRMARGTDC